jgi:hypothetical protein
MRLLSHGRSRRGAALVETAIILPILIVLIGIAIDYSRIVYGNVVLSGTARNGAIYEFDPMNTTESNYTSYSNCALADATNMTSTVTVTETVTTTDGNTNVMVNANTSFSTISSWLILPQTRSVDRAITIRKAQLTPDF